MTTTHESKFEISADGTTDEYDLGQVNHKVMIHWPATVTAGAVAVQTGNHADRMIEIDEVTSSEVIHVEGPGLLRFVMSGYAGSGTVTIEIGEILL